MTVFFLLKKVQFELWKGHAYLRQSQGQLTSGMSMETFESIQMRGAYMQQITLILEEVKVNSSSR